MTLRIDSPDNPRLKALVRLRERRARDGEARMLVEGRRELARALASGAVPQLMVVGEGSLDQAEVELLAAATARGAATLAVSARALAKLAYRDPPESRLIGVLPLPGTPLSKLAPRGEGPVLVLAGAEKPGNVGAVLRSADGAGAAAVVLAGPGADLGNPNLVRASLGTVFALPLAAAPEGEVLAWAKARGLALIGASPEASCPWDRADLTGPIALVLGSEAEGLPPGLRAGLDSLLVIPMAGIADSLNLAQAATVLLYEALRQRRLGTPRVGSAHPLKA